ncbi:amidohydrolase family protein [Hyphococcus sp.]|uniref:amidohydrolase family protein n=1 Tax=Hyphococcus sp. TaxID=2038636 RepID=UPI003CCB95E7
MGSWLELTHEEPLSPDIEICDPHHHLWKDPVNNYFLEEFLSDISNNNVTSSVYVECQRQYNKDGPEQFAPVGETKFIDRETGSTQHQASPVQIAAGIVGFADLTLGSRVAPVLESHLAASDRFRGIRYATAHYPDPAVHSAHTNPNAFLMSDTTFREGFGLLERFELTFDAWVYFTQLLEIVDIAEAFPNIKIIVNHTGGVLGIGPFKDSHADIYPEWLRGMRQLSKCENVFVKLGGLTMKMNGFQWHKRNAPPTSSILADVLSPYFIACIELFGSNRCMFESNFPIDRVSCSYTVLWNAMKRITSGASRDERSNLFRDTATRVYGI